MPRPMSPSTATPPTTPPTIAPTGVEELLEPDVFEPVGEKMAVTVVVSRRVGATSSVRTVWARVRPVWPENVVSADWAVETLTELQK